MATFKFQVNGRPVTVESRDPAQPSEQVKQSDAGNLCRCAFTGDRMKAAVAARRA